MSTFHLPSLSFLVVAEILLGVTPAGAVTASPLAILRLSTMAERWLMYETSTAVHL